MIEAIGTTSAITSHTAPPSQRPPDHPDASDQPAIPAAHESRESSDLLNGHFKGQAGSGPAEAFAAEFAAIGVAAAAEASATQGAHFLDAADEAVHAFLDDLTTPGSPAGIPTGTLEATDRFLAEAENAIAEASNATELREALAGVIGGVARTLSGLTAYDPTPQYHNDPDHPAYVDTRVVEPLVPTEAPFAIRFTELSNTLRNSLDDSAERYAAAAEREAIENSFTVPAVLGTGDAYARFLEIYRSLIELPPGTATDAAA